MILPFVLNHFDYFGSMISKLFTLNGKKQSLVSDATTLIFCLVLIHQYFLCTFSNCRQLLEEEKEGLLGDIAFLQVQLMCPIMS